MRIDYSLYIKGEQVTHSPRPEFIDPITNSSSRIFELMAGNGYGKTFMLNLISFACYSDKLSNDFILKKIKDSVARYDDKNSYDLSYNLEFDLPDGKKINLFKESYGNRSARIGNELVTDPALLHQMITVLYDVPMDPNERLNAVIKDLGIWNNNLFSKLDKYWKYLRNIQLDFNNIRDDSRINELQIKIQTIEQNIERKVKTIDEIDRDLNDLIVYSDLLELSNEHNNQLNIKVKLDKSQSKLNSLPKPVKIEKKDEAMIQKLQREKNLNILEIKNILNQLTEHIINNPEINDFVNSNPKLKQKVEQIQLFDIDNLISSGNYIENLKSYTGIINDISYELTFFIKGEEMGKKHVIYYFLKELLKQISNLKESNADDILEKVFNATSSNLEDDIEKIMDQNKTSDFSEIKSFLRDKLTKTKNLISIVFKLNANLLKESAKKGVDSTGDLYYKTKDEIELNKSNLKKTNIKIDHLRIRISAATELDISRLDESESIKNIISAKRIKLNKGALENLNNYIKTKQGEKESREKELSDLINSKNTNQAILKIEQGKKASQFSEKEKENINNVIRSLGFMIQNLGKFNIVIETINSGDLSKFQDKEDQEFINIAGKIIAYSMDNKVLRPDGVYIYLDNYDMLKNEFICEGNIRIKKDDISTGLASANYLRQRIKNVNGKYVIVLLDEIGNMAKDTLYEVIKTIKELEDQKRLVIALLTQPIQEGIIVNEY